jgi:hypothetical protein
MSDWSRKIYDAYDEMLDDCYPMVKIGNLGYSPSRVLKEVDPIAYRCGLNDYLDSLAQDGLFCFDCEKFECYCKEEWKMNSVDWRELREVINTLAQRNDPETLLRVFIQITGELLESAGLDEDGLSEEE